MLPVFLAKIKTRDGEILEGVAIRPKIKSKITIVWLHGLSSRFSSGQTLMRELSGLCQKNRLGYLKFNNRGHDIVSRGKEKLVGAGFEKFTDCVSDIRAMILFAKKLGYKNIILAGHSTGANKALYYVYKTRDRAVKKLILLGPISDIAAEIKQVGRKKLAEGVKKAEDLKKKNPMRLMPRTFGICTAARFLSLYKAGSPEDTFPYHNPNASWKELKSVKIPVLVGLGRRDEYLDRPAKKLLDIFAEKAVLAHRFSGVIIKGADHGFRKKEKEIAREIMKFIKDGL